MKIGLIDIEPKVFNTVLIQISAYHKVKGDEVCGFCGLDNHVTPRTGGSIKRVCKEIKVHRAESEEE